MDASKVNEGLMERDPPTKKYIFVDIHIGYGLEVAQAWALAQTPGPNFWLAVNKPQPNFQKCSKQAQA